MKLKELEATKIILSVLGERGMLKPQEELAAFLKQRLTKKEMQALNAKVKNEDLEEILKALNVDEARFNEIIATGSKKIKNEATHKEFYVIAKRKSAIVEGETVAQSG
jgi:hypothetical protein